MARKNQKLINFHGTVKGNLKPGELNFGEIAVLHGAEEQGLAILNAQSGLTWFATSAVTENAIANAVTTLSATAIAAKEEAIAEASAYTYEQIVALSGSVLSAVTVAKEEAITSASSYTDAQVLALSGSVLSAVTVAKEEAIAEASAYTYEQIVALSGSVLSAVTVAKEEAIAEASAYTAGEIASLKSEVATDIASAITVANEYTDGAITNEAGFRAAADEAYLASAYTYTDTLSANVVTEINAAKSSAIVAAVSAASAFTLAQVGSLSANVVTAIGSAITVGNKYTDDKFAIVDVKLDGIPSVEGSGISGCVKYYVDKQINDKISSVYRYRGSCTYDELPTPESGITVGDVWNVTDDCEHDSKKYPAGTNFACVDATTTDKNKRWDALAGTIDLSAYAKKEYVDEAKGSAISAASAFTLAQVEGLSGNVVTAIATAKSEAIIAATSASSAYTDFKVAELSAKTISGFEFVELSAATRTEYNAGAAYNITDDRKLQMDFAGLIIDCGEF